LMLVFSVNYHVYSEEGKRRAIINVILSGIESSAP